MRILNKEALDQWMNERMRLGRDMVAIKGAVEGYRYSDGELCIRPINVAWKDCTSGEVIDIEWEWQHRSKSDDG